MGARHQSQERVRQLEIDLYRARDQQVIDQKALGALALRYQEQQEAWDRRHQIDIDVCQRKQVRLVHTTWQVEELTQQRDAAWRTLRGPVLTPAEEAEATSSAVAMS